MVKQARIYQDALNITEHLASRDPENAGWQRDLSVCHEKMGDIAVAQGNLAQAETSYQAGLEIRKHLASRNPDNADWQHDLSVSHGKIGDIALAQENLPQAETSYQAALEIADRLASRDPDNVGWQRDLAFSYAKLAGISEDARPLWYQACDIWQNLDRQGKLAPTDRPALEDSCRRAQDTHVKMTGFASRRFSAIASSQITQ